MRFLFVHQNFPGQFLHILCRLAGQGAHEIFFITEPNPNEIPGVRKITYDLLQDPGRLPYIHRDAQEFDLAMRRAGLVADHARQLKALGFTPDIIIGHEGWGEMLHLPDIWPDVPRLGYQEFYYRIDGVDVNFDPEFPVDAREFSRIRAKNAINLLSLTNGAHGLTPTQFQYATYPDWAQRDITVLHEGVNLDICRPANPDLRKNPLRVGAFAIQPHDTLLTYVARDLEPYRGFHTFMRALPALLRARPDLKVVLVGGDGISYGVPSEYGSWRAEMLHQLQGQLDLSRICFAGKLDYADYLRVMQRSDAHVYLTYPFVASWSLREALACGCAVIASDTAPVHEFITHENNGLLTPCLDPATLADTVLRLLEDPALARHLRRNARAFAEAELRMDLYLARYEALIAHLVAGGCTTPTTPVLQTA